MADKYGWDRMKASNTEPYQGAKGGFRYCYMRDTKIEEMKIWIDISNEGVYGVKKSTHLGNYKFKTEPVNAFFSNAVEAKKWVNQEFKDILL